MKSVSSKHVRTLQDLEVLVCRLQIETFVLNLFNRADNGKAFEQHIRDFLIQIKVGSGRLEFNCV